MLPDGSKGKQTDVSPSLLRVMRMHDMQQYALPAECVMTKHVVNFNMRNPWCAGSIGSSDVNHLNDANVRYPAIVTSMVVIDDDDDEA